MNKLQIKIPLILSEVPDEKDLCVHKLLEQLEGKEGIEKAHIASEKDDGVSQLCFHYNPDIISLERVEQLVRQTGAEITEKYGHKLIAVEGIRHTRHARKIENNLKRAAGILEASVSATGMIALRKCSRCSHSLSSVTSR